MDYLLAKILGLNYSYGLLLLLFFWYAKFEWTWAKSIGIPEYTSNKKHKCK